MSGLDIDACPGHLRLTFKNWYVKPGETPEQATYCGVCVHNGCIPYSAAQMRLIACTNANCDCPNPAAHPELNWVPNKHKKVTCETCAQRHFLYASISESSGCGWQIDMANTLCDRCSGQQQRCHGCGKSVTK